MYIHDKNMELFSFKSSVNILKKTMGGGGGLGADKPVSKNQFLSVTLNIMITCPCNVDPLTP